jgi:ABC-type transport system involved in cytochrome bd biosynthesis fused ATPase/permease subunit
VKLSKSSWIILALGIVLIAGISLGMSRSQQAEQQKQLTEKLAQAKAKLATINIDELTGQKNRLTQQVEQYSTQTESVKQNLFAAEDDIEATDIILESARSFQVEVVTITSPGAAFGELQGTQCRILPMKIQLNGDIDKLADFIYNLSQIFPTSIIQEVRLNNEEPATSGAGEKQPATAGTTSADISLVIYSYEGK